MSMIDRRKLLAAAALAPLAGYAATAVQAVAQPPIPEYKPVWPVVSPREAIRRRTFPEMVLRTHTGKTVRLYEDLIKDKFVTINFMYINCADGTCPVTTYNLLMMQALLKHRVGKDLFMYSITLDPQRDTTQMLANYAEVHGTKPGWTFLRAEPQDTEILRRRLGFVDTDPEVDAKKSTHTAMFRYGNEPRTTWGMTSGVIAPEVMARNVLSADWPQGSAPATVPAMTPGHKAGHKRGVA